MKRRVALVEFSIYDQFPLVSGYLHGYAKKDPFVDEEFEFVYFSKEVERTEYRTILNAINALNADIVCFSCYVWNMGLIKRLVNDLRPNPKIEKIILGGHQVSHHIERYIDRSDHKTVVINGQGEIPFRAALQQIAAGGKLSGLKGVSLFVDGELWNGGEADMLKELDEIPSPFLSGQFDRFHHPITIFETNRGCPYKCTFCTWGGDTLTVTKFALERVKEELRWISKKSVMFIYLADANWGMLPRDIEISEHITRLKKENGFPWIVYYAAAKNTPKGSVACIKTFHDGGVIASQALGVQSMNTNALSLIDRGNIKNSAYIEMFEQLKANKIDSYCELIWPLPGETLETLKEGFEQLVELGARTIIMYPAILINNARLTAQAPEFGIDTIAGGDWKSEVQVVKKTRFADAPSVDEGFWFYYSYFLLANCDANKALLRYLNRRTNKRYAQIVSEFADYLRTHRASSPYAQFIDSIFKEEAHGSLMTIGRLAAHLTHERRLAAQSDVANFIVTTQLPGEIDRSLILATLWTLSLPRLFADTRDDAGRIVSHLDGLGRTAGRSLSSLAAIRSNGGNLVVEVLDAHDVWGEVAAFLTSTEPAAVNRIEIKHPSGLVPYNAKDANRNFVYAHGMIQRLVHVSPSVKAHRPS